MITCCEIAITLAITNILSLAVFAGYTVKIRQSQVKLEKKNGSEQKQIDELKKALAKLKPRE
jgi:Tfp pilus assembly protein PilE